MLAKVTNFSSILLQVGCDWFLNGNEIFYIECHLFFEEGNREIIIERVFKYISYGDLMI